MSYTRFGLMILTSTVVMFFLMYLNSYAWEHLFFSETRSYMALLMGAVMAVIMLGFMLSMYSDKRINLAIFIGSIVVFALSLWLVRSQITVSGPSYMRAMIPHHSIAVMTSERAQIKDARVRKLADEIIAAQRKEIAQMRYLIADVSAGNMVNQVYKDPDPTAGSVQDALNNTLIAKLDLAPLTKEQASQALQAQSTCRFYESPEDDPLLWMAKDSSSGAVLFNGVIIGLQGNGGEGSLSTDGMSVAVAPLGENADWRSNAMITFKLDQGLEAGYRGFLECDA